MTTFLFVANQLALDFVNTQQIRSGEPVDLIRDPVDLRDWMIEASLITQEEGRAFAALGTHKRTVVIHETRKLRAALRAMAKAMAGYRAIPSPTIETINEFLGILRESYQLEGSRRRYRLTVARDKFEPRHALAQVARSAAELIANGKPHAVRKCGNPACILYFYDTTRNHTRQWCSMALCGNRMKVAAYYRRNPRRK